MNIRNTRELTALAARRLSDAPARKRIVLIYAGLLTGLALLTTLLSFLLGLQIDRSGGLSNMGTRTILSALQTMLSPIQMVLTLCLGLGYRAAMLRVGRGQYVSPKTLRLGFDRFWVLLRCAILQALIFLGIAMGSTYLATTIFIFSPLSHRAIEIMTPYVNQISALSPNPVLDDALAAQLLPAMTPVLWIFLVIFAIFAIPMSLRYRMVDYVIIDRPGTGALAALRQSRDMMRYNYLSLLKLDLHLWWYYAALVGSTLLCYGDTILPMLGIQLPMSQDAAYYVFYALYLVVQFAIYYFLCNRVETTYALAYESIRPVEEQTGGAVLGNIFQM